MLTSMEANIKKLNGRIARVVARRYWDDDVQINNSLGEGAWETKTAGHGGLIAQIPDEMPQEMLDALTSVHETILRIKEHGTQCTYIKSEYDTASWMRVESALAHIAETDAATPGSFERYRILVGEEDVDWALVVLALQAVGVRPDWDKGRTKPLGQMKHMALAIECAQRWNEQALTQIIEHATDADWKRTATAYLNELNKPSLGQDLAPAHTAADTNGITR